MHFSSLPWTKLGEAWRQNEQVQITIFPCQLFLSKTSIYWIYLVQWSLGFRGISLFALQERERGSTKRFSKFAERDAKRNAERFVWKWFSNSQQLWITKKRQKYEMILNIHTDRDARERERENYYKNDTIFLWIFHKYKMRRKNY